MLHTLIDLEGFTVNAVDGYIGKVKDFYFDDRAWKIRHLVAETGIWLKNRRVLLPAVSIKCVDRESKTLTVDLSMNQVKNGPGLDKNLAISPQTEIDYLSYYGYSFYRGKTDVQGQDEAYDLSVAETFSAIDAVRRMNGDRHLRSCKEIINYNIEAIDSEVGHLQGMLFNEDTWAVQYLLVNTSNWWLGHQVLLEPQMIRDISWGDARIYVDLLRQQVQDAPIFNSDVNDDYEREIDIHFHQDPKVSFEKKTSIKHT